MKNQRLNFPNDRVDEIKKEPNKMVMANGYGPKDKKCKDCLRLNKQIYHGKTYYKCSLVTTTRGKGTDIKLKWSSCGMFSEELAHE